MNRGAFLVACAVAFTGSVAHAYLIEPTDARYMRALDASRAGHFGEAAKLLGDLRRDLEVAHTAQRGAPPLHPAAVKARLELASVVRAELIAAYRTDPHTAALGSLAHELVELDPLVPLSASVPRAVHDEVENARREALGRTPLPWVHVPRLVSIRGARAAVWVETDPARSIRRMELSVTDDLAKRATRIEMSNRSTSRIRGQSILWTAEIPASFTMDAGRAYYAFEGLDGQGTLYGDGTWYPVEVLASLGMSSLQQGLARLDGEVWAPGTFARLLEATLVEAHRSGSRTLPHEYEGVDPDL